jgi:hypothetical protein
MNSWQRVQAYARQRGQDPFGQVTFTSAQARRYVKKWRREFRRRSIFGPLQPPDGRDLNGQGVKFTRLMTMEEIRVEGGYL